MLMKELDSIVKLALHWTQAGEKREGKERQTKDICLDKNSRK